MIPAIFYINDLPSVATKSTDIFVPSQIEQHNQCDTDSIVN